MFNFQNCKILKIRKFFKLTNFKYLIVLQISQSEQFGKLPNFPNFDFWGWGLEFQISNVRIDEITNSAEYQIDEQNKNFRIFKIKIWFSKFKKKIQKFPKFYNFDHQISIIDKLKKNNKIFEIWQFLKLSKFQKFPIW